MPNITVHITDEFNTVWSVECLSSDEALNVVRQWLTNMDKTPIFEISIQIH